MYTWHYIFSVYVACQAEPKHFEVRLSFQSHAPIYLVHAAAFKNFCSGISEICFCSTSSDHVCMRKR